MVGLGVIWLPGLLEKSRRGLELLQLHPPFIIKQEQTNDGCKRLDIAEVGTILVRDAFVRLSTNSTGFFMTLKSSGFSGVGVLTRVTRGFEANRICGSTADQAGERVDRVLFLH